MIPSLVFSRASADRGVSPVTRRREYSLSPGGEAGFGLLPAGALAGREVWLNKPWTLSPSENMKTESIQSKTVQIYLIIPKSYTTLQSMHSHFIKTMKLLRNDMT